MNGSRTPFEGDASTVQSALQVSGRSWIPAVGDPSDTSKAGIHRLAPQDVDGLPGRLGRARRRAAASGGDVRVMLVYEAGHQGFWLARRLEGGDLEVVVRDPASLEVVGGKRKVKTDRTGARRMVRAPPAWDGGARDAMSPVRVPTVAEEDARRLPPRRDRLVRERRRLANTVDGLTGLHGVLAGDPARPGFRERPAGMETGYGAPLPPGLRAGTGGILDRLDPVRAEPRRWRRRRRPRWRNRAGCSSAFTRRPAVRGRRVTGSGPGRFRRPCRFRLWLRGTPTARRCRAGCAGPARTTRCRWPTGPSTGSCAAGGSWRAPRGWRRCPSRAGAAVTARGSARRATRCCEGIWCGWPGAGRGTSRKAPSPRGSGTA